ncbi:hypothetical protein GGTG_13292 [Gaeumannomyces tritici R3-111a-1]|uniref:Uncharacterized protein n=1 Tax=Gaeumannomyces tritici (strain R3-111a-1) TaxID=644352 RepID=J3PIG4_GAET3|nr:hypothetical protein GGTG_13292 [Gaeumannomyces tritici R3-111a-1]EJT69183.1 hypothetical protein GGTG_13292 [Gaeumannomyces tritici R3-111a-1]
MPGMSDAAPGQPDGWCHTEAPFEVVGIASPRVLVRTHRVGINPVEPSLQVGATNRANGGDGPPARTT